jgi:hypothetical protein
VGMSTLDSRMGHLGIVEPLEQASHVPHLKESLDAICLRSLKRIYAQHPLHSFAGETSIILVKLHTHTISSFQFAGESDARHCH